MPAKHDFIPSREAELINWSLTFLNLITATPAAFGLTAAQAAAYATLHGDFKAGYLNATNQNANSMANIAAKNQAKAALKANARMLARIVWATPGVTDAQRGELGLTVPDPHLTPVDVPAEPPLLSIASTVGRVVSVRLRDKASPTRRGKPPGCAGAVILSYAVPPNADVTERTAPSNGPSGWRFQGNATRTLFKVNIASDVPAGSKVWIIAQWYNTRGERGPASTPQATYIGEGVSFSGLALAA